MDCRATTPREAVVAEALGWLRTPYHHMGRVKGPQGGADCLSLLAEVYERAGVVPHVELPFYPPDWHLHRPTERYLEGLLRHAAEIAGPPEPGDIALWRYGRAFSHAAIVIEWPGRIVHSDMRAKRVELGAADKGDLTARTVRFFSPWSR